MTQLKTIWLRFSRFFGDFIEHHTRIDLVLVALGVLVMPTYLVQFKLGKLFLIIQSLAEAKPVPTFSVLQIFVETAFVGYAASRLVSYFMQSSKIEAVSKFEGYHKGLMFTPIPEHLIAPEIIKDDEDTSHMTLEMVSNLPTAEDLVNQDETIEVDPSEDLFKYYESMYFNEVETSPGPKTTAEILQERGVDIESLLNEIQENPEQSISNP